MNMKNGHKVLDVVKEAKGDKKVQKFLKDEVTRLITELKIK